MYRHASTCLKVSRSRAWRQDVPGDEFDEVRSRSVRDGRPEEMRLDLIARVRREIAAGDYDTPEKWEIALGRLLDRVERG
jgi:hypothetical protein